jgi:predicted negative regulator of RcsB-dependent stress response
MVRSPKRITRKDIRRPDRFVTLTRTLFDLFAEHRTPVLLSLTLVLVLLAGLWGWDFYKGRQNRIAAEQYSRALSLYHQGKYRESLNAFAQVVSYRQSRYSPLALLYQANSYLALKEPAKAVETFQEFLRRERREPFLRQLAFLTLGHTQETAGQCKAAVVSFAEAAKLDGAFKEEALLGKARCSAQNRDLNEALNAYRQYLSSYPGSDRIGEISLRIQEIEAKSREAVRGK